MTVIMRVTPRARSTGAAHYDGRVADQLPSASAVNRQPILLREARREDVPEIVALLADDVLGAGREGPADAAYFAAFDQIEADPRSHLLVAEVDGRVVGTLQLTTLPGLSRHGLLRGQIEAVRVAAGQRGQRLGRLMIEWAIEAARTQGCGLVQLTSDKQRPDAIRFYESLGFTASHEGLKRPL
jgi:GNAT superfamily N-acetyltransferase